MIVRLKQEKLPLLVMIGVGSDGRTELVALAVGGTATAIGRAGRPL